MGVQRKFTDAARTATRTARGPTAGTAQGRSSIPSSPVRLTQTSAVRSATDGMCDSSAVATTGADLPGQS
ncbi:hypothetical protein [Frankia sp. AgB32]|uniref:hypothetical protein n=1 Tax=Frankia sp. AgB32 TaxID=631119 RepID=UPI00200F75E6|nr:hypothetical protein [Frankia sp. AgB32]